MTTRQSGVPGVCVFILNRVVAHFAEVLTIVQRKRDSFKNTSQDNPVYNLDLSSLPLMTPEFNWEANSLLHSAVRSSFSWCRLSISSHNIMHSLPSVLGLRNPDRGVEASSGVVSGRGDEDAAWEWAGQSSCGRVNPASVVLSTNSTIPDISKSPLTCRRTERDIFPPFVMGFSSFHSIDSPAP